MSLLSCLAFEWHWLPKIYGDYERDSENCTEIRARTYKFKFMHMKVRSKYTNKHRSIPTTTQTHTRIGMSNMHAPILYATRHAYMPTYTRKYSSIHTCMNSYIKTSVKLLRITGISNRRRWPLNCRRFVDNWRARHQVWKRRPGPTCKWDVSSLFV